MFRRVHIPDSIPGSLYLAAMPGRYEPMETFLQRMDCLAIHTVVCLTPLDEIRERSPGYYRLITTEGYYWEMIQIPVPDFGVPVEKERYISGIQTVAENLTAGRNILVHCAAGIGRTGTFAMILLSVLGMTDGAGAAAVRMAGARPEGPGQEAFISWCTHFLKEDRTSSALMDDEGTPNP